jgi:hypothetical protein
MRKCDSVIVRGLECDGHLGKFDSCLDEALCEWALDETFHERDDATGDVDFEGHVTALIVERDEEATIDIYDTALRTVLVPAGNYLVWVASSGAVTVTTVDTAQEAREIIAANAARYDAWERGCDPDRPDQHERCAEADRCEVPDWVDA